ncbi:MAG: phage terminase large subunit family protein [Planctomycetia bacterium]|nr:phage terminase large subunit family protein [Planctomycetia bacterium]
MVRYKDASELFDNYDSSLFGDGFASDRQAEHAENHAMKYADHKQRAKERQARISEEGREIGPLPPVLYPELVGECRHDFLRFMLTFGNADQSDPAFPAPFCDAQLYAIRSIQETLLNGGSRPLCLPRGFAKSTFCEWGIAWALCYGHQRFILIIGAKQQLASQILENVGRILFQNDLLAACFPSLVYPVLCLDGSPGRAPGQTLDGEHTNIKWNSRTLICPTVAGAPSSGCIVTVSGLDGAIRGMKVGSDRPTCVIVDDPQTEKSAASVHQTDRRWNLLSGAVKGLAGPSQSLAMIATITVQRPDDLSEKILAAWGGRRFSMLRTMPEKMELWEEYNKLREIGIKNHIETADQIREANVFYLSHRSEMDAGAEAEWEYRFDSRTEVSAIQHAMNLYFANKQTFFSEYQNRPLAILDEARNLTRDEILRKIVTVKRYTVPLECERVTCGIDIQQDCLYWVTTAWGDGFRGHVLDYGRFPEGRKTIQDLFPDASEKDAFYLALGRLCPILDSRSYQREDGTALKIEKGLIDANRGLFTPQVRKICYDMNSVWEPVFGWGKGADELFIRGGLKPGEQRGENWQRPALVPANLVRHTRYDTNYWKSSVRTFWQAPAVGSGTLTLFDGDERSHYDFIQHQLSEKSVPVTGPRGTIDKWTLVPGLENHLWDCLIMATVAASVCGSHLASATTPASRKLLYRVKNWSVKPK